MFRLRSSTYSISEVLAPLREAGLRRAILTPTGHAHGQVAPRKLWSQQPRFAAVIERLTKIGARVIEHVARIRIHLPTSCSERALFRTIALGLMPAGS